MMPGCMSPDMIEEMEKQRKEQREKDAREGKGSSENNYRLATIYAQRAKNCSGIV